MPAARCLKWTPYNITWNKYGSIQYVNIYYSNNSTNGPWKTVALNVIGSNQTHPWVVPDDIGNNLRVNVSDASNPNVYNLSSYDFKIIGSIP